MLSLSQGWCCARAARGQSSAIGSTGHRVMSLGIVGAKQAGGRFAFSRKSGSSVNDKVITLLQHKLIDRDLIDC